MATMTETLDAVTDTTREHVYHAATNVLTGHLQRPINQKIEPQATLTLNDRRGGHLTRSIDHFSLEGLITFNKGETRVSGARSVKTNGWVTVSTSIVEELNAVEVISVGRLVSQVSTEHAHENGHIPSVTFLGTQFRNFEVSGFPVTLNLDLGFCGGIPANSRSYLRDPDFLGKVRVQTAAIAGADGLPKALKDQYDEKLAQVDELIRTCDGTDNDPRSPITCSLVQSIGEIPIPGVKSFGNVLVIPEFGSVALAEIEVGENTYKDNSRPCVYFTLRGLRMKMGCIAHGENDAGTSTANGNTVP